MKAMRKYSPLLKGEILDFGCGNKPYRSLFNHVERYIGVDVENEGHNHVNEDIDIFYDGRTLPFEDNSFDGVLSNEVFEHVPDLDFCLAELHRVLKPQGQMLVTVPFVCFEHEMPFDFRRFTQGGLVTLLEKNGFDIVSSEKTGYYFEAVVQLFGGYVRELLYTRNKYLNLLINAVFIAPFFFISYLLSFILPKSQVLYFDTVVLCRKKTT